jgi:hypothetical protein
MSGIDDKRTTKNNDGEVEDKRHYPLTLQVGEKTFFKIADLAKTVKLPVDKIVHGLILTGLQEFNELEEVYHNYRFAMLSIILNRKQINSLNVKVDKLENGYSGVLLEQSDLSDEQLEKLRQLSEKSSKSCKLIVTEAFKHYLTIF